MAKTKKKRTSAKKRRRTLRRRKMRTRRNPSTRMNPLLAYTVGGFSGLATSKLIDSMKRFDLFMGITGGNVASTLIGYLMYAKGKGAVKQIGVGHLASAIGLTVVNLADGLTGHKLLKGGLHGLEEFEGLSEEDLQLLEGFEGVALEDLEATEDYQILEDLEALENQEEIQVIGG
ncbi:MAG: hypothetical protein GXO22_07320 [Aquificae bacterium]|nr:hypothetical protein [Aquificota bacterium]